MPANPTPRQAELFAELHPLLARALALRQDPQAARAAAPHQAPPPNLNRDPNRRGNKNRGGGGEGARGGANGVASGAFRIETDRMIEHWTAHLDRAATYHIRLQAAIELNSRARELSRQQAGVTERWENEDANNNM